MSKTDSIEVKKLIAVNPDWLIELGHRLKQTAMDEAFPGEAVRAQFTADIDLVFFPEKEFQKPKFSLPAATSEVTSGS